MRYVFRGRFSKGLDAITIMDVTFEGREPSEVRDAAAASWFDGHPDYVRVAEEPEPEKPRPRIVAGTPKAAKPARKPRKKKVTS
jgi:hypothetical protein